MKLVIITFGLFIVMKMVYGFWGDYYSDYWSAVYYIVDYLLMSSLLWYMYIQSESVLQRWFFMLGVVYFAGLLLLHIVCLFEIGLYKTLVSDIGYFSIGSILLTIGILYIKFKMKKPCRKNLDKKHSS